MPTIEEYKVGPLPRPRYHGLLRDRNSKDKYPVPYNTRSPFADHELRMWEGFLKQEISKIDELLRMTTDGYTFGNRCHRKCLTWLPNVPGQFTPMSHKMWVNFFKDIEGSYLHPIGLQIRVDATPTDMRRWRIDYVWWRGTTFMSMDQFVASIRRRQVPMDRQMDPWNVNSSSLYSSVNFRGNPQPRSAKRGPKTFLPDGRRYKVDGHRVDWQGWTFQFGVRSVTGLHLNDIRFLNERIVYELSLQEIAVFSSGQSPVPLHSNLFNTLLNLGKSSHSLIPGMDCPHHATYFDMVHYLGGRPFVMRDTVCVFEHNNAVPMRRHYEANPKGGYKWAQGMDDNVLIARAVVTVDSYDYIVDYVFHQNGGIEVKVTHSGYTRANYNTGSAADRKYGFVLFKGGIAPIQHHLVNLKVDIDINGIRNRVETLDITPEKVQDTSDMGAYLSVNQFTRNVKRFEMDAATIFKETEPKYMLFHNQQKPNSNGNPRAYRLQTVGTSLVLPGQDWNVGKSAEWGRYHVMVTKQEDSEDSSSSIYNGMFPFDPVKNFKTYLDNNQNIMDEDVVAWVTLGNIHIPHTEDIPLVTTQNTQMSFHLTPFNYFDQDPSLSSRDNIKTTPYRYNNNYTYRHDYQYAGVSSYITCYPRSSAASTSVSIILSVLMIAVAICCTKML